jgi:hypothetical protein
MGKLAPGKTRRCRNQAPADCFRRMAPSAVAAAGDAVQQRQPLRTPIQEFHLVTQYGGIPL